MSDIVYTKAQIISRRSKRMPWELHPDMKAEAARHLEIMHSKHEEQRWLTLFVEVVICESDAWPTHAEIAHELPDFLKAVRQGAVKVYKII